MIDPKLLRANPDTVRGWLSARGADTALVDELLDADAQRREKLSEFEAKRSEQKGLGKQVAQASGEEKSELLARTKSLAAEVKAANEAANAAGERFDELMKRMPNQVLDQVPRGGEEDFVTLETIGEPRDFAAEGFEPRDHVELGEMLGAIDLERGAKVSGSRFYFLTGVGARLEFALLNHAMAKATEWGFTQMIPPALVRPQAMEGTGYLGQGDADDVYHLPADDLYLVGTSEVALAAYHGGEILEAETLPRHYAAFSPCYRREAGSHGKDTRGIFRVHWFDKVEMFVHCDPADAEAEHERLLGFEKDFISSLELPFRVIDVASGDLGMSAARKFDCEAWLPSQQRYREITSTSNCTEFQARRMQIRGRFDDGVRPIATLNGTLCAMTRMIIMVLENHQQADGSVHVPAVLQPYLGLERLEPVV
ncbi:serine--tRNA ligase [Propioniferax innocua]|uniref:Serine--tRNA ligase n=1 Tax=Propioniferax innocua TaxID=1753 RepID=A0A542ZSR0_9ACTN|nr:serine--tRNA ligase [Propioniferax innocua]TQL63392.1 seryl-tRNA synthetase [Propioniferax innocua]